MKHLRQCGKKWVAFTVALVLCTAAVLTGAFLVIHHIRENYAGYTPDQITQRILQEAGTEDLVKVQPGQIPKHYDIPVGVVKSSSVYMSKSSESASELACFLLTDVSRYDQLKKAIDAHISDKAAGFKSLNPTQYNAVKNVSITHSGRYVLVSVGSASAAEEKVFLDLLQQKS